MNENQSSPLGVVSIVHPASLGGDPERIGLWSIGAIYKSLGVTKERFARWESCYGMDSLGVGTNGGLLVAAYPVFSKVAWMYIDPVDLSSQETEALITECERAIENLAEPDALAELNRIRSLAVLANARSATLRFGHP